MQQPSIRALLLIAAAVVAAWIVHRLPVRMIQAAHPEIRAAAPAWAAANCSQSHYGAALAEPVLRQTRDDLLSGAAHFDAISEELGIVRACAEAAALMTPQRPKVSPDLVGRAIALFEP